MSLSLNIVPALLVHAVLISPMFSLRTGCQHVRRGGIFTGRRRPGTKEKPTVVSSSARRALQRSAPVCYGYELFRHLPLHGGCLHPFVLPSPMLLLAHPIALGRHLGRRVTAAGAVLDEAEARAGPAAPLAAMGRAAAASRRLSISAFVCSGSRVSHATAAWRGREIPRG